MGLLDGILSTQRSSGWDYWMGLLDGILDGITKYLTLVAPSATRFARHSLRSSLASLVTRFARRSYWLLELNMSGNEINDQDCVSIGSALLTNDGLNVLNLSYNKIGDAGAKEISAALKLHSLSVLDLNYNVIGEVGGTEFGKMLRHNEHLTTLGFGNNKVGDVGGHDLFDSLTIPLYESEEVMMKKAKVYESGGVVDDIGEVRGQSSNSNKVQSLNRKQEHLQCRPRTLMQPSPRLASLVTRFARRPRTGFQMQPHEFGPQLPRVGPGERQAARRGPPDEPRLDDPEPRLQPQLGKRRGSGDRRGDEDTRSEHREAVVLREYRGQRRRGGVRQDDRGPHQLRHPDKHGAQLPQEHGGQQAGGRDEGQRDPRLDGLEQEPNG